MTAMIVVGAGVHDEANGGRHEHEESTPLINDDCLYHDNHM
jgi:hypothetical protein